MVPFMERSVWSPTRRRRSMRTTWSASEKLMGPSLAIFSFHVADGLAVQHQVAHAGRTVDEGGVRGAGALRGEIRFALGRQTRGLQLADFGEIESGAANVEAESLRAEVVGSAAGHARPI